MAWRVGRVGILCRTQRESDPPVGARIIAVADAYEAMTASRSYQKTRGKEEAIVELLSCSGTQFDPDVVQVLAGKVLK